jgi:hypothetical protein
MPSPVPGPTPSTKGPGRRERRTVIATTELTAYLQPLWPGWGQVSQISRAVGEG